MIFGILSMLSIVVFFQHVGIAQPPVTNIVCSYCNAPYPNHNPGCRYYVAPSSSSNSSNNTGISSDQDLILNLLISSLFKNSNNSSLDAAQKAKEENERQEQLERLRRLAEMKRIQDSAARVDHEKLMQSFKTLGDTDTPYKTLEDKKEFSPIHFSCIITAFSGQVGIYKARTGKILSFKDYGDVTLEPGDIIATGPDGHMKMHYEFENGNHEVEIGYSTNIMIRQAVDGTQYPYLLEGRTHISKPVQNQQIQQKNTLDATMKKSLKEINDILTPTTIISMQGTDFCVTEDSLAGTEVVVLEGLVKISSVLTGKSVLVEGGNRAIVSKDGTISLPVKIDITKFEKWW